MNPLELTGQVRTHVVQMVEPRFAAQARVVEAFLDMAAEARAEGLELHPFSSFRGIETQTYIWNAKFRGEKVLYDRDGRPRDHHAMSVDERLWAILCWSALPGGSRHQWGTEIDVIDRAAMPPGYRVCLLPSEVAPGGVFARLHAWLDQNMHRFGFFRPYARFQGGMYPEPWHLSFAEISLPALEALSVEILREALNGQPIEAKARTLELLPEMFERHVKNICPPPWTTGGPA